MSVQAMSWVLDHSKSRGLSRLVLISIANHCDKFGQEAFPANKTIAEEAGVSPREVRYCIADLVQLGEVKVQYQASKYSTNVYVLAKMTPAQFAAPTRQAGGKECPPPRQALADEPSLTVQRVEAPSAPSTNFQYLNQLLDDWYAKRWQTDEEGKKYLLAPASPHRRVYENEIGTSTNNLG